MFRREKRRYLALKILGDASLDERDVISSVWGSILQLFGEYGASQTQLSLIEYDQETRQAILRCSHEALDLVKASIVAVTEIDNGKAAAHTVLVSGTLKSLKRKISRSTA